jgi:uncharacterized protein
MHYLLFYEVVADYVERRAPLRQAHLELAQAAVRRGELVLGGALADPIDGSVLLFQGDSPAVAEAFAKSDPYVLNGLVTSWKVRPWTTVVGGEPAMRLPGDTTPGPADPRSRAALVRFLRRARFWTVASTGRDGAPQAAVIGVAVTDGLELVFDTLTSTRKCTNLRRDARAALVMYSGAATAQIEGIADEPKGAELERARADYLATFPDGAERIAWPEITWVRVRPTWLRINDFGGAAPATLELDEAALAALPA